MLTFENLQERRGLITGSEVHKILKPKGFGDTGESYLLQKVAEKLTVQSEEEYKNKAMEWGSEWEQTVCELVGNATGLVVLQNDKFINKGFYGCTPDAYVNNNQYILEIKCPFTILQHTKNLLLQNANDLKTEKPEYYWQIQMELLCTGLDFCDYVSFHPYFIDNKLFALRIYKNETDQLFLLERLNLANEFIKQKLNQINTL